MAAADGSWHGDPTDEDHGPAVFGVLVVCAATGALVELSLHLGAALLVWYRWCYRDGASTAPTADSPLSEALLQTSQLSLQQSLQSRADDMGADGGSFPAARPAAAPRLQSLDAVRGLNVLLMILADNSVGINQAWLDHSPWDAVHLADFVMPLFLFMVGVSMAFAMRKYSGPGLKWKVLRRTAKLFVLGCLTQVRRRRRAMPVYIGTRCDRNQRESIADNAALVRSQGADISRGGRGVDAHNMRVPGILQRIAFACD